MPSTQPFPFLLPRISVLIFTLIFASSNIFALTSSEKNIVNDSQVLQDQKANNQRHSYEIKMIDRLLERHHYKRILLDDTLSKSILNNYIDSLDPARLFLTQADVDEIKKLENNFDDYIRHGITSAYHSIFNIYQTRVQERISHALHRLESEFDFDLDEYFELDRSESSWPLDENEMNALWRKRIKNDLINLELGGETSEKAVETLIKRYRNIAKRSAKIKDNEIFQIYINAYANVIEPHTSYLTPRASEEFNISMRLSLQGIGAVLRSKDDQIEIISVVPGGPADQSGLIHSGDKILGVAQETEGKMIDIYGWLLSDVVDIIRGPKGSRVRLSILPSALGASSIAQEVSIIRDKIKLESQAAKSHILEIETKIGESKFGIINLPSFYLDFNARRNGDKNYRSTTRDVAQLILELNKEQIDGIIIDLRGNGGGSLEEVINLTGLFIDEGPVVQVKSSDGRVQTHRDIHRGNLYNGPLAVMVDQQSASASEIFAGAIQDYKRGLIIGEPTYGKGTVQNVLSLGAYATPRFKDQLGELKITIAQFFRINGDSTQHRGVIPDIKWPFPEDQKLRGESALDNALPWRKINESDYVTSKPAVNYDSFDYLILNHQKRIEQSDTFKAAIKRRSIMVDAQSEERVSLNMEKRITSSETLNASLLEAENQLRISRGKEAYTSIKQMRKAKEKQYNERTYNSKTPLDIDPFLTETANILNDYRHLNAVLLAESGSSIIVN